MKKLFVLLLALSVLAGAAIAQAKVGIYSEFYATPFADDDNSYYGNYTNLSLTWAADDMGMSITTELGTGDFDSGSEDFLSSVRNFDVWYSLFEGKAKIYTGDLRQTGDARLTSFIEGNGFSTRIANADLLSVMLMVKPIDGLVLDVVLPLADDVVYGTPVEGFENMAFGAGYTIADTAKIVASYRMANEEIAVGVDLLMVEGLTARVGFKNLGTTDVSYIYATAGYALDALTLGLDADFVLDDPFGYGFEVQAEYGMEPFAFGVIASYGDGDAWFDGGFAVYPYARMDFSMGSMELGFQLNADDTWQLPITFIVSM